MLAGVAQPPLLQLRYTSLFTSMWTFKAGPPVANLVKTGPLSPLSGAAQPWRALPTRVGGNQQRQRPPRAHCFL